MPDVEWQALQALLRQYGVPLAQQTSVERLHSMAPEHKASLAPQVLAPVAALQAPAQQELSLTQEPEPFGFCEVPQPQAPQPAEEAQASQVGAHLLAQYKATFGMQSSG